VAQFPATIQAEVAYGRSAIIETSLTVFTSEKQQCTFQLAMDLSQEDAGSVVFGVDTRIAIDR
jgi:hypothetical protein